MKQRADIGANRTTAAAATAAAAAASTIGLAVALSFAGAGCVSNSGLLVILQNQEPVIADTSHDCVPPSTATSPVGMGTLDLETSSLPASAPPYIAYPLVQNSLPARATVPGGVEPNAVNIEGVRTTIHPPPGLTVTWPAGCPATFLWPSTATLLPTTTVGLTAHVILPCHAQTIHDLFASGVLPSDFAQQVLFTVEMRVVGTVSGSEIDSDAFRFSVRTCIGCLQTGFPNIAQYNFPARPPCGAAPKPNPYHGNSCNVAQDTHPLLCCTGDMNQIVCPAPDM
jgi:hypothetical protein